MTLQAQLTSVVQSIATDIKALVVAQGSLAALSTTENGSLVGAINELFALISGAGGAGILDTAGDGDTTHTWSANKITDELAALRSSILNGVDPAWDTLQELAAGLSNQDSAINNLLTAVGNRVRFDAAQTLTTAQKLQACQNIGIGDPETDLVAIYNAAKA